MWIQSSVVLLYNSRIGTLNAEYVVSIDMYVLQELTDLHHWPNLVIQSTDSMPVCEIIHLTVYKMF